MSFIVLPIQFSPNTGFGVGALQTGAGSRNIAFGTDALKQITTTGEDNIAIGYRSGRFLTTQDGNVLVGSGTMENATGAFNIAVGLNALKGAISINQPSQNVAIGNEALFFTDSASQCVAIGQVALKTNNSGNSNVAVGYAAGYSNFRGESNVFIGADSGYNFQTSTLGEQTSNSFVGAGSGSQITTGRRNTILGRYNGNQGGLDIRTLNDYVVLSDGNGNPRLWITDTGAVNIPGGISLTGSLTITGGTVTANNPVLSATQTWNNAAVTFTGWQLNVTDTASNANSLLMDLQIGGGSRISFGKGTAAQGGVITFGSPTSTTITGNNSIGLQLRLGTFASITMDSIGIAFNTSNNGAAYLGTDAINTLAQRNGVNAQTLRVYNTFTDASNYERGRFAWVSNVLTIGTENAGTGLSRALELQTGGTSRVFIDTSGGVGIGVAAGTTTLRVNQNLSLALTGYNGMGFGLDTLNSIVGIHLRNYNNSNTIVSIAQAAPAGAFRIDGNGSVIINNAAVATNATDGFLYVPGCAGLPTGTPTAYTGRVPIVVDTTNNKLYFYSGGAWRDAGP